MITVRNHPRGAIPRSPRLPAGSEHVKNSRWQTTKIYCAFVFNNIGALKECVLDSSVLCSDWEGSFRTEGSPDGKLPAGNHRQFRCYCPLWRAVVVCYSPKRKRGGWLVAVQQESIPWQSFVFDAVPVIHDSKHLARPPSSSGAGRWRFSFFWQPRLSRSVP